MAQSKAPRKPKIHVSRLKTPAQIKAADIKIAAYKKSLATYHKNVNEKKRAKDHVHKGKARLAKTLSGL